MSTWRRMSGTGRALLVAVLVTGVTTFMFLPLLAVHLTAMGVPAARTGFLVGLLVFTAQAFSPLVGHLVDRLGARAVMAAGFALRIAGYGLLAPAGGQDVALLVAGVAGVGVGGSLLGLSIKTRLVAEDGVAPRSMLAIRSTFVNVGVVLGPALGALAYPLGFQVILAACVLSHLVLGVAVLRAAPVTTASRAPAGDAAGTRWGRAHWVVLGLLAVAYWAIYGQINATLPLLATDLTGTTSAIAVVFTVNGVLVVLLQYTLLHKVFGATSSRALLVLGFGAFAVAYLVLAPLLGWVSLLLFVLPLTLAEMLIGPSLDDQAIRAGGGRRTGLALGGLSAAGACGSLLGATAGGALFGAAGGASALWLGIAAVSALVAGVALLLPKPAPAPTVVLLNPRDLVVDAVRRRGWSMVVVAEPDMSVPDGLDDATVLRCHWITDTPDLLARLGALGITGPAACFGFGEIGCRVSAEVNARLGWPGNSPAALATFGDKAALRAAVGDRAGGAVAHQRCADRDEIRAAIARIGFPCVVKPTDGTGSAGVHLLPDRAAAEAYLAGPDADGGPTLVEEYLVGTEVSVEAMSTAAGHRILAVTEKATTGAPRFVETGHTLPMPVHDPRVARVVAATLDAAGLRYGISHTELMLTADGPRLIESHGRPGGDRISDMLALALGEDVFEQSIAAAFGLPAPSAPSRDRVAGIRYVEFPADRPVPDVDLAAVRALPGVHEAHLSATPGELPPPVRKSGDRHGFVVAVADNRAALESALSAAVALLMTPLPAVGRPLIDR